MSRQTKAQPASDMRDKYNQAAALLLSAMLREPHEAYRFPELNRQLFAGSYHEEIAGAWFDLYAPTRPTPTPNAIAVKAGVKVADVVQVMKSDSTALDTALSLFSDTFPVYVEYTICQQAMYMLEQGASQTEIIEYAETTRRANYIEPAAMDSGMTLAQWSAGKTSGTLPPPKIMLPQIEFRRRNLIRGFYPGQVITVAARPGMGKTQFLCNQLSDAIEKGLRVLCFSLEMSTLEIQQRVLQMRQGVNQFGTWDKFGEDRKAAINADAAFIQNGTRIKYYDRVFKLHELQAICRAENAKEEVDLILIDYLQLIDVNSGGKMNREQEVSTITRATKMLAKETGCPLIQLAQLSRAVETRGGAKKPQLSDLRESGGIEQDSDLVLFLLCPAYYGFEEYEGEKVMKDEERKLQLGIVIVAKQRNGPTGELRLRYDPIIGWHDPPSSEDWAAVVDQKVIANPASENKDDELPF